MQGKEPLPHFPTQAWFTAILGYNKQRYAHTNADLGGFLLLFRYGSRRPLSVDRH